MVVQTVAGRSAVAVALAGTRLVERAGSLAVAARVVLRVVVVVVVRVTC